MSKFLLELMVEEIPSRMQTTAISDFEKLMIAEFQKFRVVYDNVRSYVSPRRIVFSAELNPMVEGFVEEKRGPQATASSEIIEKFLRANCASIDDCMEKDVDKKTFIFVNIVHKSQNTSELLSDVVKNAVAKIPWEKSMHWGDYDFHFVRPLRNVMSVFDGSLLNIEFNEINLRSCDYTFGHRFLAPQKIMACDINEYIEKIRKAFVVVDREERKQIIIANFNELELKHNFSVDIDEKLLEEIIGLVEYPVVLFGKIPEKFMKLPEEAIITPIKVHQRYFPTRINGELAPYFVFVANNITKDNGKTIIAGNERVLTARLADALFFFDTDLQESLESRLDGLKKIVFNDRLGTVFNRVNRIANICDYICEDLNEKSRLIQDNTSKLLRRAAILSKCDLTSNMVREFAELQGTIGAYYAEIQGENHEVCKAIRDQYRFAEEIKNNISALLSLADKIEIITSFFAIGKEPTGSKDPFALRRSAIGILKIIKNFSINLNLKKIIQKAYCQLQNINPSMDTVGKVYAFIIDRLKIVLKESGVQPNIIDAVVTSEDEVLAIYQKTDILNSFLQSDSGNRLLSIYKRLKNITVSNSYTPVEKTLFCENEEIYLWEQIKKLEDSILEIERNVECFTEKFRRQLSECAKIYDAVFNFFDKILVNTDNEQLKQNRLNMLTKLMLIFNMVIPHTL